MALAARLAATIAGNSIIYKRGTGALKFELVQANGSDIFITAAVTFAGETAGDSDVDLCAKGERIDGIIYGPADSALNLAKDSDSAYADDTWLKMYKPQANDEIYLTAKANSDITHGARVQADGGFFIDFAYTNATENTDTLESVAGTAKTAITGVTGTTAIFLCKWGGK